ncbi:MAG: acyl-CoA thioesterase [Promethearchaeota archaeon]|nr:MAG: acyl-CoA thioesterase [Candidatus Lokiarchaeota archaeon]
MENAKTVSESQVELIQFMMPEHANPVNNVHGGTIMKLIDEAAAIVATRHARKNVVTVSVDKIDFIKPVYVGNLVIAKASLNFVARTSMEIGVRVEAETLITGKRIHAASAYLTFVALQNRKPIEVPKLICKTDEEKRRFEEGRIRREKRLELLKQKKQD